MPKLTKKLTRQLQTIEEHLNKAEKYLKSERVVGVAWKTDFPNGASYLIANKECHDTVHAVDVMCTFTGSDLNRLILARQMLSEIIKDQEA